MSQKSLLFWSARFLIIGGILMVSGINLSSAYTTEIATLTDVLFFPSIVLHVLGALLILMALPLLYAFQSEKGGVIGFFGFIFSFVGLAVFSLSSFIIGFIFSKFATLAETQTLFALEVNPFSAFDSFYFGGIITMSLGFLMFGISGLKANAFSSAVPLLFVVGALCTAILPIQPYNLQIGISMICLGIILAGNHIYGEAKS